MSCLHVAIQQIQEVLAGSHRQIFFSHPARLRISKGLHISNFSHMRILFLLRQCLRFY
jgi:hypothetical protein